MKAVRVKKVSKTYKVNPHGPKSIRDLFLRKNDMPDGKNQPKKALTDISFEVERGEVFGIIGRNGSGKSTLLNIIMGSIHCDKGGRIETKGKKMRLALGMGVDPNLSARDNIYVNGTILGLSFKYIGQIFWDIIDFAGLHEYVDAPVKVYSKGMRQRLIFSIAMHAKADIFLLDEFFGGVGDEEFKEKSDRAFEQQILEGKTIIIISHSMQTILSLCKRVVWIDKGKMMAIGSAEEVVEKYRQSFQHLRKA